MCRTLTKENGESERVHAPSPPQLGFLRVVHVPAGQASVQSSGPCLQPVAAKPTSPHGAGSLPPLPQEIGQRCPWHKRNTLWGRCGLLI